MKQFLRKLIPFIILLITVSSVKEQMDFPVGNTVVWWTIYALTLYLLAISKQYYFDKKDSKKINVILWYLSWNVFAIVRGLFVAENYWEWKNLVGTAMVLLLPLSIYISTNKIIVQQILTLWVRYALPLFFIFYPFFQEGDASGRYLVPISFILLFFPLLNTKWRLIIVAFSLIVLFGDLSARSNVIKFGVPIVLASTYYMRNFLTTRLMEIGRVILMLLPIILFSLGVMGIFNVFKMDEYVSGTYTTKSLLEGQINEANLLTDTRTFLYKEVLSSAFKYDYVWLGRSPARGNESATFGSFALEELRTGKMERFGNEVSILNIFTWTGIIGVILYFLVFYRASYLAINKSNNIFIRIVGLSVAFRWAYAWVEDFSNFDLSYFFLWLMIGMCYSRSFRAMSNLEMKLWIKGVFDKKYRVKYNSFSEQRALNYNNAPDNKSVLNF